LEIHAATGHLKHALDMKSTHTVTNQKERPHPHVTGNEFVQHLCSPIFEGIGRLVTTVDSWV